MMMNRLRAIFRNIGVDNAIGYITIALSLFSAFVSLFQGRIFFFYLTSVFTFLSFFVLLYFLHCANNKQHTLYMLARDSRIRTLCLLLNYDYLRTSTQEIGKGFSHSRLQASEATYSYKTSLSNDDPNLYDLDCTFKFVLKQTKRRQEAFDILILHSQGEMPPNITYKLDKKIYRAKAELIAKNDDDPQSFDGLLWAKLTLPEDFKELTVTYCLKKVDTVGKEVPIIICPFNYVDTLDKLNINLDYSGVAPDKRPDQISAYMAPYDGSRGIADKIADLKFNDTRIYWNLLLPKKKSRAHAIYIIEGSYHPVSR